MPVAVMEEEELSAKEVRLRLFLAKSYRFAWAVFVSVQLFDFLFSPVWMHGYLWSLNQPYDEKLNDKHAGFVIDMQRKLVGPGENFLTAVASVTAVYVVLWLADFQQGTRSVWRLMALGLACGLASGTLRPLQQSIRLLTVLHDVFYVQLHFFVVGLILTLQPTERFPSTAQKSQKTE